MECFGRINVRHVALMSFECEEKHYKRVKHVMDGVLGHRNEKTTNLALSISIYIFSII